MLLLGTVPKPLKKLLRPGDFAKLRFIQGKHGERMWLLVLKRYPDGRYLGQLDNDPVLIKNLPRGRQIVFHQEHIFNALVKK